MKGKIGGIATGIIIVLAIIIGLFCTERIPAGYVGVVYNMNGGVEDKVLTQGWKFVSPTKKVTKYSIALEPSYMTRDKQGDSPEDESFEIPTKEGASLEADIAFSDSVGRMVKKFYSLSLNQKCKHGLKKLHQSLL